MKHQNGTTVDLSVTTSYDPMSVDNTDDESVLTRPPIDNPKPYSQPDADTSSSSGYTSRTASTSALSPFTALSAALIFSSKFIRSQNQIMKVLII